MAELLSAAQMRAVERAAIDSGAVSGLELMERAGRGVVEAIMEWRPMLATAPHRALVLCGPGNNGGDGFVVARILRQRGWRVDVYLFGDDAKLPPDAAENCRRWREMGDLRQLADDSLDGYAEAHPDARLAIDALFGTGLTRPFLDFSKVRKALNQWQAVACDHDDAAPHVVAVDLPSGLCSDSGRYLGMEGTSAFDESITANLTVSFHARKLGHVLADGPIACQRTVVADIGLDAATDPEIVTQTQRPGRRMLGKQALRHKYSHGHALILSGGVARGGAARMAARGALRIGAGLVTLGCPPAAIIENAAQLNAIMLRPIGDEDALAETLRDSRINALLIGPGHGGGAPTRAIVLAALAARRATVLDADALTAFAADPDALFAALHEACVLTPHAGEFARLFPDIAEKLAAPAMRGPAFSKLDATREAAARAGCTLLYKGADTVIADPTGRAAIHAAHYERAAPWLATAGAGDVLAGFITGLLARGLAPMAAAEAAAWLHVESALSFGPGLIAEDLPEQLPRVFRDIGL